MCHVTTKIGMDGAWIGANQGSSFFRFTADPGEHHLCTSWQSVFSSRAKRASLASLNAEGGKVYYFRTHVLVLKTNDVYNVQEFELQPVDNDEGQLLVASSKLAVPHKKN